MSTSLKTMSNQIALCEAIIDGNSKKILEIMKKNIDPKTIDDKGDTFLHIACRNVKSSQPQLIEILKIFLDRGLDINAKNKLGKTVLQLAVDRRMRDVIDFCLERNADPNLKHRRRNSIAHFAIEEECRKINVPSNKQNLELLEKESSSFIDWMVSRGIDFFHTRNIARYSALYVAIDLNLQHVLITLLKRVSDWPRAEKNEKPILCAFLESCYDDSSFRSNPKTLMSIRTDFYESRHIYDIVKLILEKNKSMSYDTLEEALLLVIKGEEEIKVIDLLLQHTAYNNETIKKAVCTAIAHNFGTGFIEKLLHRASLDEESLHDVLCSAISYNYETAFIETLIQRANFNEKLLHKALGNAIAGGNKMSVLELLLQRVTRVGRHHFYSQSLISIFAHRFYDWVRFSSVKNVLEIVKILVQKGADLNEIEEAYYGETVAKTLFRRHLKLEMLQLLNQGGADFSVDKDSDGSFLNLVSQWGNESGMIDIVAGKGCDVNVKNSKGQTPLDLAVKNGNDLVAMDLVEHGAKGSVVYENESISVACTKGKAAVVKKLIERGADLGYKDKDGKSLLHISVYSPMMVESLLKAGVDVNAKDNAGKTTLHYATDRRVLELLLNAGALVDELDVKKNTTLFYALSRKDYGTSEELLKSGADIRDPNVFAVALDHFRQPYGGNYPKYRYTKRHFVKMIAAGLLDERIYEPEKVLKMYFKDCQAEVELLKTVLLDDETSLYEVLRKNRNRRCAYVENEKLKSLVEDAETELKFPNYFVLIVGCYNEAVTRKSYLEMASWVLKTRINISLPDSCVDQILLHLSSVDLKCLVESQVKKEKV